MMWRLLRWVIKVTDVWKAIKTAELLIPEYLVRVESKSKKFSATALAN
jgi:hypothetical protein